MITEREAFKEFQQTIVNLCDHDIEVWKLRDCAESEIMIRVIVAQRNSCIVHLQGVNATQSPPDVPQQALLVDPYADTNDPPSVAAAKKRCKAMLTSQGVQTSDDHLDKFFRKDIEG